MRESQSSNTLGASHVDVSNIIVTYNSADEIESCLNAIRDQEGGLRQETLVIDNDSSDETAEIVSEKFPEVRLVETGANLGFAAANNLALEEASGDFIVLINPDSVIGPGAIAAAVDYLRENEACGLCGGLLVDEEGETHPSARKFPTPLIKFLTISGLSEKFSSSKFFGAGDFRWFDHQNPLAVDWVPGAFTCIRREVIEELGFFDERFFLYYEETDLCLRAAKNGWETHFIPDSVVVHEGGASGKKLEGQVFDSAGGQVRRYRMMAECLYHRKNFGLVSVIANVGVEWLWHQMRRVVNLKPGPEAKSKRLYSKEIVSGLELAMKTTDFGRVCPPRPW